MDTLRFSDRGPFVQYLQLALTRAGYAPGSLDGIFGVRTLRALEQFQRDSGLAADGIAGRLTWGKLFPYLAGYTLRVLRPGDTFSRLASLYDTSVSAIETANPGFTPENLPAGATLVIPLGFPVVPDNVAYSYALTSLLLDGLAARYPFLSVKSIGSSVMGKRLLTASLGTGDKALFYNGAHHANEWITAPVLLLFLEKYARAVAGGGRLFDQDAKALFKKTRLSVTPLVNPDGVDLVTGALPEDDSYYGQARALSAFYPAIPFPAGWKANIAGTDLNLGYPAEWERAREIKFSQGFTRPGPRDYVGARPLAEPENRAVYEFTRANDFLLTLSYHTQGKVIFWKFLDYDPPRAETIARAFSQASGYALEDTPYASSFAGYKDWFIQDFNRPGYTVEAGLGQNPLPISDLPSIYRDNVGILTLGMVLI